MRQLILRACALAVLAPLSVAGVRAQTAAVDAEKAVPPAAASQVRTQGSLFALEEVERQLRAQRAEIEQLRAAVKEQSRLIDDLRARVEDAERLAASGPAGTASLRDASYSGPAAAAPTEPQTGAAGPAQPQTSATRVARVEDQAQRTADAREPLGVLDARAQVVDEARLLLDGGAELLDLLALRAQLPLDIFEREEAAPCLPL